jgi:hypothetical protein
MSRELPLVDDLNVDPSVAEFKVAIADLYYFILSGFFDPVAGAGTANAQTAALGEVGGYKTHRLYVVRPTLTSTGACTYEFDSLGAKNVKLIDGNDPFAGAITAGFPAIFRYSGTNLILLNPCLNSAALSIFGVTATSAELNISDESANAVSNYASAMREFFYTGNSAITVFDVDANITENTFESIGPTGSGATNILSQMNVIPDGAKAAIFTAVFSTVPDGSGIAQTRLYGRITGGSAAIGPTTQLAEYNASPDAADSAGDVRSRLLVPLDSNKRGDIAWFTNDNTAEAIELYLTGFMI